MLTFELRDFDIEQIADSGQCFRMYRVDEDMWEVYALNRFLKIRKRKGDYVFECKSKEFNEFWANYFDLYTDYEKIKRRILSTGDSYLIKAVEYGSGLRILRQDLWEMIVSWVISQRSNIPRIQKSLKKLCDINCGKFPLPEDFLRFSEKEIAEVKLGYRKKYLLEIARKVKNGSFNLEKLKLLPFDQAIISLKSLYGVGDKVANCIALSALGHIEAFPVDVWIKRILEKQYNNDFSLEKLGLTDIGGIVQQYMYYYERKSNS